MGPAWKSKYKKDMDKVFCEEAILHHDLKIDVQWSYQPAEMLQKVSRRELDAAIIPAGLDGAADKAGKVCQVTLMDSQILHLFAKPEVAEKGLAGLSGHTVYLGPAGSGVRCVAGEILKYAGLAADKDFVEDPRSYDALMKSSAGTMPDAVFCLSPLPSPIGDKLARQFGYQLVELPMGQAMGLRRPCFRGRGGPHRYLRRDARGPVAAVAHGRRPRHVDRQRRRAQPGRRAAAGSALRKRFLPPREPEENGPRPHPAGGRLSVPSRRGPTCTAATPGSSRSC